MASARAMSARTSRSAVTTRTCGSRGSVLGGFDTGYAVHDRSGRRDGRQRETCNIHRTALLRERAHSAHPGDELAATKMPTRSQTCWTWCSRWLESRTATPSSASSRISCEDLRHAGRVDRGGGLVEDDDQRLLDQHVGQAKALLHAARVGRRPSDRPRRPGRPLEQTSMRSSALSSGAVQAGRVAQVLAAGHARRRNRRCRAGSPPGA